MTVAARQPKVIYQGNGETVLWDIPFPFFNKEDVVVYVADESGKQTRLTGGYAVVREGNGAQLHYPLPGAAEAPLAPGRKLLLLRNTPLEQAENFEYAQRVDSDVVEKGYDASVMILQELAERLDRAVVFPAGYPPGEHDAAEYLGTLQKTLLQAQDASAQVQQSLENAAETVQTAQQASAQAEAAVNRLESSVERAVSAEENARSACRGAQEACTAAEESRSSVLQSAQNAADAVLAAQTAASSAREDASSATESAQRAAEAAASLAEGSALGALTGCITKIPQDIKLELEGGVLKLKAGSRVYIPDGLDASGGRKFKTLTLEADVTGAWDLAGEETLVCLGYEELTFAWRQTRNCFSGEADPGSKGTTYYDTAANVITAHNNAGDMRVSLPVALVRLKTAGAVSSVEQVFNGFGYVGSTVYGLPGVSGVIPAGRNEDGSLKNSAFTLESVCLRPAGAAVSGQRVMLVNGGGLSETNAGGYFYDSRSNYNRGSDGGVLECAEWGSAGLTDGKISGFKIRPPFRCVDYSEAAGLGMPSSRYVALSVGASGSRYTAPADGYFVVKYPFSATSGNTLRLVVSDANGELYGTTVTFPTQQYVWGTVPVRRGRICEVQYANLKTSDPSGFFRFYYAEGEV